MNLITTFILNFQWYLSLSLSIICVLLHLLCFHHKFVTSSSKATCPKQNPSFIFLKHSISEGFSLPVHIIKIQYICYPIFSSHFKILSQFFIAYSPCLLSNSESWPILSMLIFQHNAIFLLIHHLYCVLLVLLQKEKFYYVYPCLKFSWICNALKIYSHNNIFASPKRKQITIYFLKKNSWIILNLYPNFPIASVLGGPCTRTKSIQLS